MAPSVCRKQPHTSTRDRRHTGAATPTPGGPAGPLYAPAPYDRRADRHRPTAGRPLLTIENRESQADTLTASRAEGEPRASEGADTRAEVAAPAADLLTITPAEMLTAAPLLLVVLTASRETITPPPLLLILTARPTAATC